MRKIIISGAGGFLGSNIVKKAHENGIDTLAVTSGSSLLGKTESINTEDFLKTGCSFSAEDIFIHCMFPTNADGYKMADGLDKAFKIISTACRSGVGAIINISSQSVYASKRTAPAKEEDPLCLETPYAVGKYCSEIFVNRLCSDIFHTNIRMASLLGIGYDQRIVNRMVDQALRGETLRVIGGMQRYGFLDVRDAAAGILKLAASNPKSWKETYNVGRKESYTLIDVVECICAETKKQLGLDIQYSISDGQDFRNSAVDPTLFMTEFKWVPEISLSQTTADIIREKLKLKR